MRDVVIDTDVVSLLQKHQAPPWVLRNLADARIWLTFVTVAELAKWAVVRKWGQDRRGHLDAWIAERPVIPYDTQIARIWGGLAGAAQLRGRPRPQNDTWIAACCLRYQVPLVTLNTADFGDFAEYHRLVLLGQQFVAGPSIGGPERLAFSGRHLPAKCQPGQEHSGRAGLEGGGPPRNMTLAGDGGQHALGHRCGRGVSRFPRASFSAGPAPGPATCADDCVVSSRSRLRRRPGRLRPPRTRSPRARLRRMR